ncbi:HD domain-containing protein [Candidatus Bathyarchaeota archaeon]|nr:HD domain-containing protein [Candidatus Bathyarchaeota archaeon]
MLNRDDAISLVRRHVSNENLVKHMISVGAIMKGLATNFREDVQLWELVGILHDIDYEKVGQDWTRHGAVSADMVKDLLPENGLHAIRAHNDQTGYSPKNRLDISLYSADALSGLVVAMGLMMPDKKLLNVKTSSLVKRMKDKSFARGVSRENIYRCVEVGLSLEDFLQIGLVSMQGIASEIGM